MHLLSRCYAPICEMSLWDQQTDFLLKKKDKIFEHGDCE